MLTTVAPPVLSLSDGVQDFRRMTRPAHLSSQPRRCLGYSQEMTLSLDGSSLRIDFFLARGRGLPSTTRKVKQHCEHATRVLKGTGRAATLETVSSSSKHYTITYNYFDLHRRTSIFLAASRANSGHRSYEMDSVVPVSTPSAVSVYGHYTMTHSGSGHLSRRVSLYFFPLPLSTSPFHP